MFRDMKNLSTTWLLELSEWIWYFWLWQRMKVSCRRQENTWTILGLLGIKKSILVINKCDLVDEEWLELVEEEIQEELEGYFFWKVHRLLKYRLQPGRGLDELTDTIQQLMSDEVVAKDTQTIPKTSD